MNRTVAKRHALAMMRRRVARGWCPEQIVHTTFEGSSDSEACPGYLMSGGRLSFPGVLRHSDAAVTFSLRALLDEVAGAARCCEPMQADLFGVVA